MDLIHQIFDAVWIREICLNFSQFVAVEWFLRFGCFLFGKTNFILKKVYWCCLTLSARVQKRIELESVGVKTESVFRVLQKVFNGFVTFSVF